MKKSIKTTKKNMKKKLKHRKRPNGIYEQIKKPPDIPDNSLRGEEEAICNHLQQHLATHAHHEHVLCYLRRCCYVCVIKAFIITYFALSTLLLCILPYLRYYFVFIPPFHCFFYYFFIISYGYGSKKFIKTLIKLQNEKIARL